MRETDWVELYRSNRGKFIGIGIGLISGIFILTLGFIKTLILAIFIFGGYWVGKRADENRDIREWLRGLFR